VIISDQLALEGEVVEEIIDLVAGSVVARIVFATRPAPIAELLGPGWADTHGDVSHWRGLRLWAVIGIAALLIAGLVVRQLVMSNDEVARVDRPTALSVTAPAAGVSTAPEPPRSATVTTSERADNTMTVTIAEDPADTSATSTVGPTPGYDRMRVMLQFSPERTDSGYAASVIIENRGDQMVSFDGGADAVLRATRDGAVVEEVTLRRDDIVELAPGERVSLDGVLRLSEPGTYELTTSVDVTTPRR
jgi:hypothetical protein